MSVTSSLSPDGHELTIAISGRLDFASHQDFRAAYEAVNKHQRYVVDLKNATYVDSSGLGMLLLLRDHAGGDRSIISVINCSADVSKILAISNFDKLFKIKIEKPCDDDRRIPVHPDR